MEDDNPSLDRQIFGIGLFEQLQEVSTQEKLSMVNIANNIQERPNQPEENHQSASSVQTLDPPPALPPFLAKMLREIEEEQIAAQPYTRGSSNEPFSTTDIHYRRTDKFGENGLFRRRRQLRQPRRRPQPYERRARKCRKQNLIVLLRSLEISDPPVSMFSASKRCVAIATKDLPLAVKDLFQTPPEEHEEDWFEEAQDSLIATDEVELCDDPED